MSELSKDQLLLDQSQSTERERPRTDKRRSWCSDRLLSLFRTEDSADTFSEAYEAVRRRRVLDFLLSPGRVSAKFQDENSRLIKIELLIRQFSEAEWRTVFSALSEQALVLATLLAGELSVGTEQLLAPHELSLCLREKAELILTVNGQRVERVDMYIAAVILKLCERLDEDAFAMFLLRGRGRDEVKLQLRRERAAVTEQAAAEMPPEALDDEEASQLATVSAKRIDADKFWSMGESMKDISYAIRADELPAALLKRLDPLPLGGLEDEVDYLLEEAYGQVTRRAQVYGLSMK